MKTKTQVNPILQDAYTSALDVCEHFKVKVTLEDEDINFEDIYLMAPAEIKNPHKKVDHCLHSILKTNNPATVPGWQISIIKYFPGTRFDPPDSDVVDVAEIEHKWDAIKYCVKAVMNQWIDNNIEGYAEEEDFEKISKAEEEYRKTSKELEKEMLA